MKLELPLFNQSAKLDVPLVKQLKDSVDCGLAGLSMIFGYYGTRKTIDELRKSIKVYKGGTYAPQLATYMIKNGFDVTIVTAHPSLFMRKDWDKEMDMLKHFKALSKEKRFKGFKNTMKYFVEFLENGGKIEVHAPNRNDIESEISHGRPLGALMTTRFLNGKTPRLNFHFNVITGIDKKFVYTNDPADGVMGGKKKYLIEDFFYGLYTSAYGDIDNACLIKIRKK